MKTSGVKQIAERYVRALFDASKNAREEVEKDIGTIEAALAASDDFRAVLSNPLLSRDEQAKTVEAVLASLKVGKIVQQFVALLAKQKRLPLLPDIIDLYQEWAAKERGEMQAEVISAAPLADGDLSLIKEKLSKTYGKNIVLKVRQDPNLLGGVVIRIGSVQLDASVSGKLRRLKNTLKAA